MKIILKKTKNPRKKLNEILNKAAVEYGLEGFEAESVSIYFWDDNVVVYYWPLDDSAEMPVELFVPIADIEDIK